MKQAKFSILAAFAILALAGCTDPTTTPTDSVPPAGGESSSEAVDTPASEETSSSTEEEERIDFPEFPDLATEADTTGYTVSFKAPEGWADPNLWAWTNEGGANAYQGAAWPGRPMEEVGEGWYQLTVPTRVDILIINANQGTETAIQTEGLSIQSKDVWFDGVSEGTATNEDGTPRKTYNLTAFYEAPTGAPSAKSYVSEAIFGVLVPNAWRTAKVYGVDDEGKETLIPTAIDSDGYMFMGYARSDFASYYVTDGAKARSVNFSLRGNNGGISWYAQVGEYLLDGRNEAGVIAYEAKPLPEQDTYRFIVTVPETWTDPHLWTWNKASGAGMFSTWPGESMNKNDDGTFYYDIIVSCDMIIVNNGIDGDGAEQTGDLADVIDTSHEVVYGNIVSGADGFVLNITYGE